MLCLRWCRFSRIQIWCLSLKLATTRFSKFKSISSQIAVFKSSWIHDFLSFIRDLNYSLRKKSIIDRYGERKDRNILDTRRGVVGAASQVVSATRAHGSGGGNPIISDTVSGTKERGESHRSGLVVVGSCLRLDQHCESFSDSLRSPFFRFWPTNSTSTGSRSEPPNGVYRAMSRKYLRGGQYWSSLKIPAMEFQLVHNFPSSGITRPTETRTDGF